MYRGRKPISDGLRHSPVSSVLSWKFAGKKSKVRLADARGSEAGSLQSRENKGATGKHRSGGK
jgi:hypothetical protein